MVNASGYLVLCKPLYIMITQKVAGADTAPAFLFVSKPVLINVFNYEVQSEFLEFLFTGFGGLYIPVQFFKRPF